MKVDTLVIGNGAVALQAALESLDRGESCAVIAPGLSLEQTDWSGFVKRGGILLKGDRAEAASVSGGKVEWVRSRRLGPDAIVAGSYVLATGRFYDGGRVADMDRVYEPLFGLDVEYEKDRSKWFDPDFFAPQPFLSFGVRVDADGHPSVQGVTVNNLLVKGEILAGCSR